jgi:bifunctional N-acetylglucosamine-1-phosphate-uridyltransferase/glucosamine-1-phosphate-acetyltransferase GlmU-like protein
MERTKAIILAAGRGSRLNSETADTPKALRPVNGKYLIDYVLDGIDFIAPEDITVVVGCLGEQVVHYLGDRCAFCWQKELKGTAHAALCAEETVIGFNGPVMVLYCDMPLLSRKTYQRMVAEHLAAGSKNTLLAARIHPIPAFGRLLRDESGILCDIVEESACTPAQKLIDEVNVGIQVMAGDVMWDILHKVTNDNPKHEYYLTGAVKVVYALGYRQHAVVTDDKAEYWGVNTLEDLNKVEAYLRQDGR